MNKRKQQVASIPDTLEKVKIVEWQLERLAEYSSNPEPYDNYKKSLKESRADIDEVFYALRNGFV